MRTAGKDHRAGLPITRIRTRDESSAEEENRTMTELKITEKIFTAQLKDLARTLGWRFYHPFLSISTH